MTMILSGLHVLLWGLLVVGAAVVIYFLLEITCIVRSFRKMVRQIEVVTDIGGWFKLARTFIRRNRSKCLDK